MKQFLYTACIFAVFGVFLLFRGAKGTEHDVRLAFEKDGCKIYSFKTLEGIKNKMHYFTTCKGEVIEPDEINITEVEGYEKDN